MFYNIYTDNRGYKCTAHNDKAPNNEVKDEKKYLAQLNKTSKFTTMSNQHLQQSQKVKYSNETINETSNSSTTMVQEKSNNGSAKKSSDSTRKLKKKSDLSESRERFNNIRYFYADPEIDKAAERPLVRLNPMTMFYMGVSDDNSHLLQSANCNF